MNLNVYAVTRRDPRVDAGKVVVASYVTKPVAQAVAREQRELGVRGREDRMLGLIDSLSSGW